MNYQDEEEYHATCEVGAEEAKEETNFFYNVIYPLATFMHEEYEKLAIEKGWKTQKECQCDFEKLPDKNKQVMIYLAEKIYFKITP